MQTITSLRSQLLNELVRTGLVHAGDLGYGAKKELKADAVVNRHAGNEALTTAVLTTGVPGNLASRRRQSHFGVMRTRLEATAGLHPASVSFHRSPPRGRYGQAQLPDWFMYKEMVLSSQVFLRDCSAVTPEQLALFGGSKMNLHTVILVVHVNNRSTYSAVNTTTGGIVSTILAFTLPQHGNTELTSVAILSAAGCFSVAAIDKWKEINQINLSLGELEIAAEYLKKAQKYISMVLDNDNDDRVLSGIFSNFCIGK